MVPWCILTLGILVLVYAYSVNNFLTVESFKDVNFITNKGYPTSHLCAPPLTTVARLSGPAEATLDNPRDPYNLLGDYLEPATKPGEGLGGRIAKLSSECAYIADGQRQIELTGSYGQITNNYKKTKPDNGSTWLRELSLSFYK
jgi:hypothetical protein